MVGESISNIADLKPDSKNARKHNQRNLDMIVDALHKVGAARSIVIDENGVILAGNGVVEAAADAGIERVQVVDADGETIVAVRRTGLTDEQKRKLAYYDNRTAEVAEWDAEQIAADLEAGFDFAGMFSEEEMHAILEEAADALLKDRGEPPEAQVDRAEELREKWQTERGQLWEIPSRAVKGKAHRLLCGDSTNAEDVAGLMGGERLSLVWTDPPYGVSYGAKLADANPMGYRVRNIANDDLSAEDLELFIRSALARAAEASVPGAAIYVACPAGTLLPVLISAFTDSGFDFHWGLVWVKDQLVLGRGDYHFKHENILYGWKPDAAHYFVDDRTQVSVFEVPRPKASEEHPTMKPVELVAQMIKNSSRREDIVYDAFCGSGTTMVACEQLGRRCYGMEIEPKYVAVTLERMADMGLEPRLLSNSPKG